MVFSTVENLLAVVLEFRDILVSLPVYTAHPNTYSVFLNTKLSLTGCKDRRVFQLTSNYELS